MAKKIIKEKKEVKEFGSFVFTHIPKCGGTSFRKYLNDAAIETDIKLSEIYIPGFNNLPNDKNIPQLDEDEIKTLQSQKLKILANHCKFGEDNAMGIKPLSPFNFTILRDPVKRFISHYHFFYYTLGYNKCKGVSLDKLDDEKLEFLLEKLSNVQVGYISNIKLIKIVGLENMLKISKYNIQYEFDAFGIVENMDSTINYLKKKCPQWLKLSGTFPTLNTSNSKKVKLSDRIIEKIKVSNKYDLELYNFSKKLLQANSRS